MSRRSGPLIREERATVVAVAGGRATVELEPSEACAGCGICAHCGSAKMRLELHAVEGLAPGRHVIVAVDRSFSLSGALLLFGLPLAGLIAGALLGQVWPVAALGRDGSSALFALLFLVLAFAGALVYDRVVVAKRTPAPTIVRIEPE